MWKIDAAGLHYRELNSILRTLKNDNVERIELHNVHGQRYIGTNLKADIPIDVYGTPGNDLGAFMNSPHIVVHGNVQDGVGNTMNHGQIVVHGHAGDVTGYSMRGGKIFIRDDVGYRAGIHMKQYKDKIPLLMVGGEAQDFLGEYMAGGILIVLELRRTVHKPRFVGTGMHGGTIYLRGEASSLGKDVKNVELREQDKNLLKNLVEEFCNYFNLDAERILDHRFSKIIPVSHRPYGRIYAY
ncbi:MAG: hypothetical protein ACOC6G_00610 [Thermoproteota archaeon]